MWLLENKNREFEHIVLEKLNKVSSQLENVTSILKNLVKEDKQIMAALDDLTAQVTAQVTVEDSAITLLNQLTVLIQQAGTDPVKLAALTSQLKANADTLAAAVVANTPQASVV